MLPGNRLDSLYIHFKNFHNQWVVCTFLAFSGYGVMYQIRKSGQKYLKGFPRKRLLKTLFNFDIAVVLFMLLNAVLGISYSLPDNVLSLIGLTSIGNSNWYIFDILIMYLISYLAAKCFDGEYVKQAIAVSVATVVFIVLMKMLDMPSRFVSTISCYALGAWICVFKDRIIQLIKCRKVLSIVILTVFLALTYKLRGNDYIMNAASVAFVLVFVWFEVFFELKSPVLLSLGKHAFSIFILQRLPMIAFEKYGILVDKPYLFVLACLLITIVLAYAFDYLTGKLDKCILG